ncbi:MAG TPA: tripartite tricarboxylate transporter substrate-binding protein [Alphaproteobacteria bacterium]
MQKLIAIVVAALLAAVTSAAAQTFPSRPITMVVPYPAGGVTDTLARLLAERMKVVLGQTVIVENVGGAGGSVGAGRVARAAADGYTVLLGNSETHVLNAVAQSLPYDVVADFAPVALLPAYPFLLVSKNAVPAKNLKELIAWIKANPDKVTQGTVGIGTVQHLCGFAMQKAIGARWQFVPYRGGAPAMQDLLGGQFDIMCTASGSFLPLVRNGQIRAYAITTKARAASAPDIPTVDEAGLPGLYFSTWNAFWAPKGTPAAAIAKLNAAAKEAMADPTVRKRITDLALEMPASDQLAPEALGALQKADIEKWWPMMKEAGIKPPR